MLGCPPEGQASGAGRIGAERRDERVLARATELGADATVAIVEQSAAELAQAFRRTAEGRRLTIVGHSNANTSRAMRKAAFPRLAQQLLAGRIRGDAKELPLSVEAGPRWTTPPAGWTQGLARRRADEAQSGSNGTCPGRYLPPERIKLTGKGDPTRAPSQHPRSEAQAPAQAQLSAGWGPVRAAAAGPEASLRHRQERD
jgi:hypothetical protein